ncbi:MAG: helix-turn-helix domain-containing protein [Candidatus Eremiobacteraeota bacterium]|nr:helix-turn-helix domain-containing protein [Candidatus Eremiobacteraeota bacterium]
MRVLQKVELGAFVRYCRERANPVAFDVVNVGVRRTPGLRREEVAERADISVGWYLDLERGRLPSVTPRVLDAIARALRMTPLEHRYARRLAGLSELIDERAMAREDSLFAEFIEGNPNISSVLYAADYTILASNPFADVLLGYPIGTRHRRNSLVRLFSGDPSVHARYRDSIDIMQAQAAAAIRFASAGKNPLVERLLSALERFPLYRRLASGFDVVEFFPYPPPTYLRDGSMVMPNPEFVSMTGGRVLILSRFAEADAERLNSFVRKESR